MRLRHDARRALAPLAIGLLGVPLVLSVGAVPAAAAEIAVTTTDDVVDPLDGVTSLREAISEAAGDGDDTIVLEPGATYELDLCDLDPENEENANASGDLDLISQVGTKTIEGNGATIVQTCANEGVLEVRFLATLVLQDLTITGGSRTAGGAVAGNGVVRLEHTTVTGNVRGVQNLGSGGTIEVVDSTVSDNDIGIYASGPSIEVVRSSLRDNEVAALLGFSTPTEITDSVVADNGDSSLSGISVSSADLTVVGSSLTGNTGSGGGAIRVSDGIITLVDSTVADNHAPFGGGITNIDVNSLPEGIVLDHATIVGNTNSTSGAPNNLLTVGDLEATASAVGQSGPQSSCVVGGTTISHGGNVESAGSCGFTHPDDRQAVGDLRLGSLVPGDDPGELVLVPGVGSPVVDRQPAADCDLPALDQRGVARGVDGDFDFQGDCDAGAVERPQGQPFVDVGVSHPFFTEVGWMAWNGVSEGYLPGPTYQPGAAVTRQAMSAFMYRLAGEPAFSPPSVATFADVGPGHPFFAEVEWMADEGISVGYLPGPTYRPGAAVTRQAMSAFMYRLAGEPAFSPPSVATFADVGPGHPFFAEVEWMADEGISVGYLPGPTYRPGAAVTRQAMSAFMFRLAPLLDP